MSGSVEASRRHVAFDSRWPKRLRLVAADRLAPALTASRTSRPGLIGMPSPGTRFPGAVDPTSKRSAPIAPTSRASRRRKSAGRGPKGGAQTSCRCWSRWRRLRPPWPRRH